MVSLHWALAEIDADGPQSTGSRSACGRAQLTNERKPYRIRVSRAWPGAAAAGCRRMISVRARSGSGAAMACGIHAARGPAMVTLELPYDPAAGSRPLPLPDHLADLQERWRADPTAYMAGVEIGVHKMLRAAAEFPG